MSTHGDQDAACAIEEAEWAGAYELQDHELILDEHEVAAAPHTPRRPTSLPPPPPSRKPEAGSRGACGAGPAAAAVIQPEAGSRGACGAGPAAAAVIQPEAGSRGAGPAVIQPVVAVVVADAVTERGPSPSASGIFPRVPTDAEDREALLEARAQVGRLQAQLRARDAYLREIEHALDQRTRQLAAAGFGSLEDLARMFGRLRGQAFRVAELESEVRRLQTLLNEREAAARADGAPATTGGGDLRRIHGIGRRFAEQLELLGYPGLRHVARWSEADIQRAARSLKITPERITRERWVKQARRLVAKAR